MTKLIRHLRISLLFSLLFMLCTGSISSVAADTFKMHVLDVGQGQAVLFEYDGHAMLIDGGGRNSSSYVVSYVKQLGIEALDCVAVSHYEEDHMSGIIGMLSTFSCDRLLLPSYAGTGELYQSLAVAALSNGCTILHPQLGDEFTLGEADVKVIGPRRTDYSSDNDMSLCFKICFGDIAFMICGDAQQESEVDLVNSGEDLRANVYVADHHGSNTSSMDAFLDAVSPQYAIISCGKDNGYGHPAMETLQRLQNHGISMYRTDQQGTIMVNTDGSDIWFDQDPSEDWTSGSNIIPFGKTSDDAEDDTVVTRQVMEDDNTSASQGSTEQEFQYVCNTNTKKFHTPSCNSVEQMKEENRLFTNLSRDELLAEGYEPCGNCRP